jgi:hypothetical protein
MIREFFEKDDYVTWAVGIGSSSNKGKLDDVKPYRNRRCFDLRKMRSGRHGSTEILQDSGLADCLCMHNPDECLHYCGTPKVQIVLRYCDVNEE